MTLRMFKVTKSRKALHARALVKHIQLCAAFTLTAQFNLFDHLLRFKGML
jgi:hypothetical protein